MLNILIQTPSTARSHSSSVILTRKVCFSNLGLKLVTILSMAFCMFDYFHLFMCCGMQWWVLDIQMCPYTFLEEQYMQK